MALVNLHVTHTWRGDVEAFLTSPSGYTSRLLFRNQLDDGDSIDWTFSTNAFWGEPVTGTWSLNVRDVFALDTGNLNSFSIDWRLGSAVAVDPEPRVVPDSYWVTLGGSRSGGVIELAESDDQYLVLDPDFLGFRYQLEYTVNATAPTDAPSEMEFSYESQTTNFVGTVEQKIELFNYDNGRFEAINSGPTSPTDTVISIIPTGDPARFVEPATAAMQARIRYQNSLPFWVFSTHNLYLPYRVRADHIFWTITP